MKNLFDNIKKKKEELSSKIFSENSEKEVLKVEEKISVNSKLLNAGNVLYLPSNFGENVLEIAKAVSNWFSKKKSFAVSILSFENTSDNTSENIYVVQYKESKGIKSTLGLNAAFHLYLTQKENVLFFDVFETEWTADASDLSEFPDFKKPNILKDSFEPEIKKFIEKYIYDPLIEKNDVSVINNSNRYIENISSLERTWFHCNQLPGEIMLAYLEISSIKKLQIIKTSEKNIKWRFVLTSERSILVGFSNRYEVIFFEDLSGKQMIVKQEIGRDTVVVDDIEWLSTLSNDNLYMEIHPYINEFRHSKIREIGRLNWVHNYKDKPSNEAAEDLFDILGNEANDPYDELSTLRIELSTKNREDFISANIGNNELIKLIKKIVSTDNTKDHLIEWSEDWRMSNIDTIALVQLLLKTAESNEQLERILPFHRKTRDQYRKNNKDEIGRTVFDIEFCRHMIACNQKHEAIQILEETLLQIPDETIADLLPPKDSDLTTTSSGQVLKINILDLLIEAKGKEKAKDLISQAARLQPLVKNRIDSLVEVSDGSLKERAESLQHILDPEALNLTTYSNEIKKVNQLSPSLINEHLQHTTTREGGMFSSFQTWLAKVEIPDFSAIKSYAEALSKSKYSDIQNTFTDITYAMNLSNVECYIARGEKGVGINSFEGASPFILLGAEHLDETSDYYLRIPEMQFAMGVEFAHLYFKHSRITSTDVWQGAKEKGILVFDTVLGLFPGMSFLGKTLSFIPRLAKIAKLLQAAGKLSVIAVTGKEIINNTSLVVSVFKGKTDKSQTANTQEQELLATSRIMQLTADRAGLLFCGDVKAAIRAIFLDSKSYSTELPTAQRYGLNAFLTKRNEDGSFIFQELAIRLGALCSFYLSDEYIQLREALYAEN